MFLNRSRLLDRRWPNPVLSIRIETQMVDYTHRSKLIRALICSSCIAERNLHQNIFWVYKDSGSTSQRQDSSGSIETAKSDHKTHIRNTYCWHFQIVVWIIFSPIQKINRNAKTPKDLWFRWIFILLEGDHSSMCSVLSKDCIDLFASQQSGFVVQK